MKDFRIELRWGILFSLIEMIWMFAEKNLGWHNKLISSQLGYHFMVVIILFIVIFYFGLRQKRKDYYGGFMTWKQGVISGGMITVFIALLSPLVVFFVYHYISPDYFDRMIDYQTHKPKFPMSRDSATMLFSMKAYIIQSVFTDLSFGIITSALLALIVRKKPDDDQP